MSKILFFVGMSGAGKTSWGRKVAAAYNLPFFDIDHYLEAREGKTITQMFGHYGEAGFREKESEALHDIVRKNPKPFVFSTGGGTPLMSRNMSLMKEHGLMVYLKADVATIVDNLHSETEQRPLLKDVVNPAVRISEIYEKRRKIYEQADYTVQAETITVADFEPIIQECIKQD